MKTQQKPAPQAPHERDRLRGFAATTRQDPSRAEALAEAESRIAAALRDNLRKRKAQKTAKEKKEEEQ